MELHARPLYLRHLIDNEVNTARMTQRSGVWLWDGQPTLSPTLAELLEARIAQVPGTVCDVLDALAVGDEEVASLGVSPRRVRLVVVAAATLCTAAAVAAAGAIGFVGIIVPHTVRLLLGPSYRVVLPMSFLLGAAFLMLADAAARTVVSPAELPIGVITAMVGAPFFLFVMRSRRLRQL